MILASIKKAKVNDKNYPSKHYKMDKEINRVVSISETYLGKQLHFVEFNQVKGFRIEFQYGHVDFIDADKVYEIYLKQRRK